eukprot:gene11582-11726_t
MQALNRNAVQAAADALFSATVQVVFHVIHDGEVGRVPETQLQQQMAVINQAFAASGFFFELLNITYTNNPVWFSNLTDPELGFGSTEREMKQALRVGNSSTLNVYILNLDPLGFLGFAEFPYRTMSRRNSPWLVRDGVVLNYLALPGGGLPLYNLGHTLTHETLRQQSEGALLVDVQTDATDTATKQQHGQQGVVKHSNPHGAGGDWELETEISILDGFNDVNEELFSTGNAHGLQDGSGQQHPEAHLSQLQWQQGHEQADAAGACGKQLAADKPQHIAAELLDHHHQDDDLIWQHEVAAEERLHIPVELLDQHHNDEDSGSWWEEVAGQSLNMKVQKSGQLLVVEAVDLPFMHQTDQDEGADSKAVPPDRCESACWDDGAVEQGQLSNGDDSLQLVGVKSLYAAEGESADYRYDDGALEAPPPSISHYYPVAHEHLSAVGSSRGVDDYEDGDDSVETYGYEARQQQSAAMQASS